MQKNNGRIFLITAGNSQSFTNRGHLHNFLKYLYSCTTKHPQTDLTQFNFFEHKDESGFVIEASKAYNSFKKKYWNDIQDHSIFTMDLYYVYFLLEINGKLVSNMFNARGNLELDEVAKEILLARYFKNDENAFKQSLKKVISDARNLKNTFLHNATLDDRKEIEQCVKSSINSEIKLKDFDVFLTISHHDQEESLYHVHRLLKKQKT